MDRGAQEAMRNSMGSGADQAGESRVLREGGEGTRGAGGAGAGGRGKCGVGTQVVFFVPGTPVGKGRPRAFRMGKGVRMFTPEKTANYESLVATAAHAAMEGRAPILTACEATMEIRLQVPASWSKKKQAQALDGLMFPTKKPDVDNVVKAIFDALNGIVWGDDVQVVGLAVSKRYDAIPGVRVGIRAVEGSD